MTYIDTYNIANFNKAIALLYRNLSASKPSDFEARVTAISESFLGRPYLLGSCGEGHEGYFDQAPLYRLDGFDCVTYVNTVLALALSNDVVMFRKKLIQIAYRGGELSYSHRHHFTSVDWNVHNQSKGLIKDVTADILDAHGNSMVETATALIDRPGWFSKRNYSDIRLLQNVSANKEEQLLSEMRAIAMQVEAEESHLPYLPLEKMFDKNGQPIHSIFIQIPHGAVVEIVRPNWDLKEKIGTNLNVSHVGFAIWKGNDLFYRQASSIEKRVCDIPFADYLHYRLFSPTVKGINIQSLTI
ncbi:MAG: DUF1460 domain-containing protein [Coxiellaceae bacterium]|nr:DUF1460 domain-containing protein [Coxiellaceae bacterium]